MCSWPATLKYLVSANDYDEFTSWELIYSNATGRICELASCGAGLPGAARMCSSGGVWDPLRGTTPRDASTPWGRYKYTYHITGGGGGGSEASAQPLGLKIKQTN